MRAPSYCEGERKDTMILVITGLVAVVILMWALPPLVPIFGYLLFLGAMGAAVIIPIAMSEKKEDRNGNNGHGAG